MIAKLESQVDESSHVLFVTNGQLIDIILWISQRRGQLAVDGDREQKGRLQRLGDACVELGISIEREGGTVSDSL